MQEEKKELKKAERIPYLKLSKFGVISSSVFERDYEDVILITADEMYKSD